jgi:uncharacterized membrane protein (UPF0127 family)
MHNLTIPSVALNFLMPLSLLSIGLSTLLIGCSPSPSNSSIPATPTTQANSPQPTASINQGQQLPITAAADINGQTIQLEVTQTPEQQEIGLMFRTELPANRGMLFSFNPPQPIRFWMRNTLIPLDMIFLRNGEVKAIAANTPPCTTETCPTYGAAVPVDQVIEVRGGRAAELGLKVGDRITIRSLTPNTPTSQPPSS